jgi:hypothetical protein
LFVQGGPVAPRSNVEVKNAERQIV